MEACTEYSAIRFKQRAVIEFLTAKGVPPIEIHHRMQAVYGDDCIDVFLNMSINPMTYEAQFFGFTPQTFMLRIYFAFQEHLSHIMLVVEKVILKKLQNICPSLTPTLIRRSTEQFFAFMKERFDNQFTKMEEPLLSTVLSIPKNVCLPEDKLQEEFCYTAQQFQELENEISQLERELKAEMCAEQALRTELEEQKIVQRHLEGILRWFDGLDNIGRNEGTVNLKESFAALTKTATNLQNIVQEVEVKMNRLRK
ncbi:LOW QUALITY PROTEIN: protein MIS12 homolog [Erythrolamprus reginae]|uniref:LOW QUALITY PROTEIN: protein MIS12 homolog n=1 Tax=Erythrolamprus reginae TaxID=121349 RepID=UPI00396C3BD5